VEFRAEQGQHLALGQGTEFRGQLPQRGRPDAEEDVSLAILPRPCLEIAGGESGGLGTAEVAEPVQGLAGGQRPVSDSPSGKVGMPTRRSVMGRLPDRATVAPGR
jgi:hypothetical protein